MELVSEIKTARLAIERKKDFYGSTVYRDAIVNYLDLSYTVLKEDYDKILDMEAIAEQSYDEMEAYLMAQEQASDKLDSAFSTMSEAQKSFAEKYDIELSDQRDKMAQQIKNASDALSYYNDVYLIFFKSYKQEAYVLEAVGRSDVSSIEQNNSSLMTFSNEGYEELKSIKSFKGDITLVAAARKALNFYKAESKNDFGNLTDYFLKKDEFEKADKRMQGLSKKERSQTEIDKYNKAVNEFNQANDLYNKTMEESYAKRSKMLTDWNSKVEFFLNKNSK